MDSHRVHVQETLSSKLLEALWALKLLLGLLFLWNSLPIRGCLAYFFVSLRPQQSAEPLSAERADDPFFALSMSIAHVDLGTLDIGEYLLAQLALM